MAAVIVVYVQARAVFPVRHDALVRAFFAQFETGPVVVVADLVTVSADHLSPGCTIDLFISVVDGDNPEFVVDDDKGFFVTVNERLEVD